MASTFPTGETGFLNRSISQRRTTFLALHSRDGDTTLDIRLGNSFGVRNRDNLESGIKYMNAGNSWIAQILGGRGRGRAHGVHTVYVDDKGSLVWPKHV